MNSKGEVYSAYELKDIYDETLNSHEPYRCPFCEVPYEARCIITKCVKAPHFKLPKGTTHRNNCNGEAGSESSTVVLGTQRPQKQNILGDIDVPEALVTRRKPSLLRKPDDNFESPPDATEVARRRRVIAADSTISSRHTTSLLRPLIRAYQSLRKYAHEQAIKAKLNLRTPEYNEHFRDILNAQGLSLYGQSLSYGNAFQSFKLHPLQLERVYYGSGNLRAERSCLVIKDKNGWPKQPKSRELAPFEVILNVQLAPDAPTSHVRALDELETLARAGHHIEWYAYGRPSLLNYEKFELAVSSLDHFHWSVSAT
jgi:hypothetical protein